MNFANAIFLWGLLALTIPIIVHLFNFRKSKLVKFSNVQFLANVKKKSSSKLQLKHFLVLFSRLLFLLFLVLAFAQPYIPSKNAGLNEESVVIYIDNSGSMENLSSENITGLTVAQSIARQIVNVYPKSTKFKILDNDFKSSSYQFKNSERTLELLSELDFSSVSRSGQEILTRLETLVRPDSRNEIFIISDFQRSTIGQLESFTDSINQFYLIPLSPAMNANISIDTVYINHPFILPHNENILTIQLKNHGDDVVEDLIVKFHMNGQQSASIASTIPPGSTQTITFELGRHLNLYNQGHLEFQDFPVTFDNDFFLSFNLAPKIKVTELKEKSTNSYIEKVFDDNALFELNSSYVKNTSYRKLENSEVLIVNGIKRIDPGLQAQISSLLQSGKTVVLFPHPETKLDDLTTSFPIQYKKTNSKAQVELKKPDLDNPFYQGIFEEVDNRSKQPYASPIVTFQKSHQKLLTSKTGQTFLAKIPQVGNLYVFTTPLSDEYTNFHKHALFVPVMQRIAELSASLGNKLYHTSDENSVAISMDSISNGRIFKIKNPQSDVELVPSQKFAQNQLIMNFPKYLLPPGNYQVNVENQMINFVSFNHSKVESNIEVMNTQEFQEKLSGVSNVVVFEEVQTSNFSKILQEKYHSIELWKYALLLSLVFLIAESFLLRFL